jgi:L-ascorbate metabolism protein UlaG (beta-lactamase superfamily)
MSTHHGFSSSPSPPEKLEPSANSLQVKEFPWIRVDAFDGDPSVVNPYTGQAPHFYLLTHAHTDHITG